MLNECLRLGLEVQIEKLKFFFFRLCTFYYIQSPSVKFKMSHKQKYC